MKMQDGLHEVLADVQDFPAAKILPDGQYLTVAERLITRHIIIWGREGVDRGGADQGWKLLPM